MLKNMVGFACFWGGSLLLTLAWIDSVGSLAALTRLVILTVK
ncbi:MAG: hypothetical protein QM778_31270 [Myxococcales bacterium]